MMSLTSKRPAGSEVFLRHKPSGNIVQAKVGEEGVVRNNDGQIFDSDAYEFAHEQSHTFVVTLEGISEEDAQKLIQYQLGEINLGNTDISEKTDTPEEIKVRKESV